jgi:NAD(P)-dependent dehydrogenase (short-subunit alcohol dehydrogenase family)
MKMDVSNVVITGAAAGIGKTVAGLCAAQGMGITLLDRNGGNLESVAGWARESGAARVVALTCDVSREHEIEQAFAASREQIGPVTGLVTCAGIDRGGLLHEMPTEIWDQVIAINLRGSYLACKYALRDFLRTGVKGSIVCISSPSGLVAHRAAAAYATSKAGVSAMVRGLAIDYAAHGIRVNAVLPGATETDLMWANVPQAEVDAMRQTICREVPLGRLADPSEPAEAVLWLLSTSSSYVTGSALVCDGGMLAKASISV